MFEPVVGKSPVDTALLKLNSIVKHIQRSQAGEENPYWAVSKSRTNSVSILDPEFSGFGLDEDSCKLLSKMPPPKKFCLESEGKIFMNFNGKHKQKLDFNIDVFCVPCSIIEIEVKCAADAPEDQAIGISRKRSSNLYESKHLYKVSAPIRKSLMNAISALTTEPGKWLQLLEQVYTMLYGEIYGQASELEKVTLPVSCFVQSVKLILQLSRTFDRNQN